MQKEDKQVQYWVGVDGGGTKCHAVVFDEAYRPLGQGRGGPANIAKYGEQALASILDSVTEAVTSSGLNFDDVCSTLSVSAGLAGAFLASSQIRLSNWQHPFANFTFTSDLHSALLGAHAGQDGAVLITGTGSCAATLTQGLVTQLGGYGFQLGDQASGAWLGQKAAQQALLVADKLIESNALWQAIQDFYQCSSQADVVELLNTAPPGDFARFAPYVFELANSDDSARAIILEGADYLNRLAGQALTHESMKLVFNGGLATLWQSYMADDVVARIVTTQHGPEWGAVYYSREQLG